MESEHALLAFAALAQPTRLDVFRLLIGQEPGGLAAGDIARQLAVPHNTMSSHLAILTRAGLIQANRHSRSIIYRAKLEAVRDLASYLVKDCCGGRPEICAPLMEDLTPCGTSIYHPSGSPNMPDRTFNVLFLCTGNSARSILAESILTKEGGGRFRAFSAGSQPKGAVNPMALKTLKSFDYPAEGFRSKAWDEFAAPDAPILDFVFTVCDNAAGEVCPIWPGQPMTAHWGVEDPAAVEGTDIRKQTAFVAAFRQLRSRISAFASLPIASLDKVSLKAKLTEIGQNERTILARGGAA